MAGQYNAIRLAGCVRISFICSCSLSEPKNKTFAYEILVVGEKGEQQLSEKEGRGGTDYRSRNLAGTITVIIVPHKLAAPFDIT